MLHAELMIDNGDRAAQSGAVFQRLDPVTGAPASIAAAAGRSDAMAAADAAAGAFPAWAALGPNARRALLLKAADGLEARHGDFADAMMTETGSTGGWAGFNVHFAALILREAAALTTQVKGETIPSDRDGCLAMSVRRPAGVVLGIAPWNAPVILGVRAIATPLACGNTVVLKASELCPATHRLIGEVMRDAGFPSGVVNVVTNAPADAAEVVQSLIAHPAVRRINFTGSTKVGRIIAESAARELKPVVLELGGKAPLIVLDDADLDQAVNAAIFGAFMNQGQICMSTERIIVHEAVYDRFVEAFTTRAATLSFGDPRNGPAALGAVVSRQTVERVMQMAADAASKGAQVYSAPEPDGAIMGPVVVAGVKPDMMLYGEESFGPIVGILSARDDDDAVRLANDTDYGLTSAIFSRDVGRALSLAERIDAGMCHINGPTVHDEAQMPFGGVKASGYGRFGAQAGVAEFTELRWITITTRDIHYPF
jgi:acyl-CoA reductase-like NAD-dependent aldehyde dehydrogenase